MKPEDISIGKVYGNSLGKTRKVDEIKQWVSYPDDDAIVWFMDDDWKCAAYLTDFARWAETEVES